MSKTVAKRMDVVASPIYSLLVATEDQPGYLSMASGNPNTVTVPNKEFAEISDGIFKQAIEDPDFSRLLWSYCDAGQPELLKALEDRYIKKMGIGNPETDGVKIYTGAQQVQDLLAKAYVNEGEIVLTEEVTYGGALTAFWGYGAKTVGVLMDEDGIIPEELEKVCQKYGDQIKLLYVIPTFQNPMGTEWSVERRKAVYDIAVKYDFLILEDSPYFELRIEGEELPSIKTFDTTGHVVFASSCSKIMAPGLRLGFVIADQEVLYWLSRGKEDQDISNVGWAQVLAARYFTQYDIDAHIKDNIEFYKKNRNAMLAAMEKYLTGTVTWTRPNGGFFLWVYLPDGVSGDAVAEFLMKEEKLILMPGSIYHPEGKDVSAIRLCYSVLQPEEMEEGVRRLADGLKKFLG